MRIGLISSPRTSANVPCLDRLPVTLPTASGWGGINSGSFGFNGDDELSSETYDQNGNVLTSGGRSFSYDSENHLVAMNGGAVRLVYDGFGNRVAKTVNGVTTKYLVEDDVNPTGYPQVFDELTNGAGRVNQIAVHAAHHYWEVPLIGKLWCIHIQLLSYIAGVSGSAWRVQIPLPWCSAGGPFGF